MRLELARLPATYGLMMGTRKFREPKNSITEEKDLLS